MKRRRAPLLLTVLVIALVAGSFVLGQQFSKPEWQDVAQQAEHVEVWAEVEQQTVRDSAELTGTVQAPQTSPLSPSLLPDPAMVTVTGPEADSTIEPGDFLGEIAGQPYFALRPPLALYRDLREGDKGADVSSLQLALADAGYEVPETGYLGPVTIQAALAMFRNADYELPREEIPPEDTAPEPPSDASESDGEAKPVEDTAPEPELPQTRPFIPFQQLLATNGGIVASSTSAGTRLTDEVPLLTLETSPRHIQILIPTDLLGHLPEDTELSGSVNGASLAGVISSIGDFQAPDDGKLPGYPARVDITEGDIDALPLGQSVVLSADGAGDEPTPAVPLTAVRQNAEGDYVITRDSEGAESEVPVEVLRTADGWAAVEGIELGAEVRVS